MSQNKTLNAVVAFIENRPEDAKELLATEPRANLSDIVIRLHWALENHKCHHIEQALRLVLLQALRLSPSKEYTPEQAEIFFEGVKSVEELIEKAVQTCQEFKNKEKV